MPPGSPAPPPGLKLAGRVNLILDRAAYYDNDTIVGMCVCGGGDSLLARRTRVGFSHAGSKFLLKQVALG